LKIKLRLVGVEPDDYPQYNERSQFVELYEKSVAKLESENSDIKRHAKLAAMTPQVQQILLLSHIFF
jgi:hypothetical protein